MVLQGTKQLGYSNPSGKLQATRNKNNQPQTCTISMLLMTGLRSVAEVTFTKVIQQALCTKQNCSGKLSATPVLKFTSNQTRFSFESFGWFHSNCKPLPKVLKVLSEVSKAVNQKPWPVARQDLPTGNSCS